MKDLINRLRQPSDFYFTDQMTAKKANALYTSLLQDGADAIEKLEAENVRLKESRDEYYEAVERLSVNREEMLKDRVALAIEIERLKAELAEMGKPFATMRFNENGGATFSGIPAGTVFKAGDVFTLYAAPGAQP